MFGAYEWGKRKYLGIYEMNIRNNAVYNIKVIWNNNKGKVYLDNGN